MYKVKAGIIIFGLILWGGLVCFSHLEAKENMRTIKGGGVEVTVPDYLPAEIIGGTEKNGYISLNTQTERRMYIQFFGIYWSDKELRYQEILPKENYSYLFETPLPALESEVLGHKVDFTEVGMSIKYPCGEIRENNLLAVQFYCDKTKRYFLILSFVDTVAHQEFVRVVKTLKCHKIEE